jgi:hypothetical protein
MDLTITHMVLVHERTVWPTSLHGDRFPCRPGFPDGGAHTHFEPRHLDGPRFPHRGSCLTQLNGELERIVKTSSGRMVSAGFLRFISLTPAWSHQPLLILC